MRHGFDYYSHSNGAGTADSRLGGVPERWARALSRRPRSLLSRPVLGESLLTSAARSFTSFRSLLTRAPAFITLAFATPLALLAASSCFFSVNLAAALAFQSCQAITRLSSRTKNK